jgi:hypothetical protein
MVYETAILIAVTRSTGTCSDEVRKRSRRAKYKERMLREIGTVAFLKGPVDSSISLCCVAVPLANSVSERLSCFDELHCRVCELQFVQRPTAIAAVSFMLVC